MADTKYVGMMFSPESIQQIVAGNKTQTRRPVKDRRMPFPSVCTVVPVGVRSKVQNNLPVQLPIYAVNPPCKPGDIIYVKEAWGTGTRPHPYQGWVDGFEYKADMQFLDGDDDLLPLYPCEEYDFGENPKIGWQSPMYMPKAAARHFLEVLDVRVERLRDISREDAIAEGIQAMPDGMFKDYSGMAKHGFTWEKKSFKTMWDSVNRGKNRPKWADNPLVFAITFRYLEDHKPAFQ